MAYQVRLADVRTVLSMMNPVQMRHLRGDARAAYKAWIQASLDFFHSSRSMEPWTRLVVATRVLRKEIERARQ